jgi:SAM-dependent methyltransferase
VPANPTAWYDAHAERYDALEPGLPGEAAFYATLAQAGQPPALELGCGTGRIALTIARAGVPVVGLDSSAAMLRVARRKSIGLPGVSWVQADMRAFALRQRFGLICIPYRSFQHLLTDVDQQATLACCREHLRPGGLLALNLFNPSSLARFDARSRLPEQPLISQLSQGRPQRLQTADAMSRVLRAAGFVEEAVYGWFDRTPFTETSTEQVWLARVR